MGFGRQLGIAITAIIVAGLLWTYVHLSTPVEAEIDIPVSVTAPNGLAVASGLPERLHARVQGAGWQILLMDFTKKAYFEVDLTKRVFPLASPNTLSLSSEELVNAAKMPSEVRLIRVEPDTLNVSFGKMVRKQVPVVASANFHAGRGYALVGRPAVTPAMVTLEGSQEVLDSISVFPTKLLRKGNLKEDLAESVELSDTLSNIVRIVSNNIVTVSQSVQAVGERQFTAVPLASEGTPTDKDILFVPSFISVMLRGGVEDLARMKPDDIRAYVMYDPMVFDSAEYVRPSVTTPAGISFLSSEPPRVRFVVRRKASGTRPVPTEATRVR